MNPLLNLKLKLNKEKNNKVGGQRNLRAHAVVSVEKIDDLINDLKRVLEEYKNFRKIIEGILIDVRYNDIIAKSNRIQRLLKPKRKQINNCIVGARFNGNPGEEKHVITYYVDTRVVYDTIKELEIAKNFLKDELGGKATKENLNVVKTKEKNKKYPVTIPVLREIIVDCSVVLSFGMPQVDSVPDQESFLISFFKAGISLQELIAKLGISQWDYPYTFYGDDTLAVPKRTFDFFKAKVPYMISMISADLSKLTINEGELKKVQEKIEIPDPKDEPVIGVIDMLFDESVYFAKWVKNTDYADPIELMDERRNQRIHGTQVTSIIVDGPRLNPELDDGCGRFRVRHYGVCGRNISISRLTRKIKEIVEANPDIHVWNLSLGTEEEVSRNFISYDAAALDKLQAERNVIFVVSGTNDCRENKTERIRIGSPADSLNSIVVNSVRKNGEPASYSRKGIVLSFFNKPDVSYYGGDFDERITAYSSSKLGKESVFGTSFAAPWISRKMCYLIDVIGLSKEIAKALIIDSAAGWEYKKRLGDKKELVGYGVVPIRIEDVLGSDDDEIKFMVPGTSEAYTTSNFGIPVPKDDNGKYPYCARAVLCYFPQCSRSQGVDYTNRELSIKFGRINDKGKILDINKNVQDDPGYYTDERQSRRDFRKWENTKYISPDDIEKKGALKSYGDRLWGLSITSKERSPVKIRAPMKFGVIVTLKEIKGVNRFQNFVLACQLRGILVNELNLKQRVNVYNSIKEELVFK